jgi:hypothetical protein
MRTKGNGDVEGGSDSQRNDNTQWQVTLGVSRLRCERRNTIESNIRKENRSGTLEDTLETEREKVVPVTLVDFGGTQDDDEEDDGEVHERDDFVEPGGLLGAKEEDGGTHDHDHERQRTERENSFFFKKKPELRESGYAIGNLRTYGELGGEHIPTSSGMGM